MLTKEMVRQELETRLALLRLKGITGVQGWLLDLLLVLLVEEAGHLRLAQTLLEQTLVLAEQEPHLLCQVYLRPTLVEEVVL